MAEKNTESTAVNQLIELVATAKPLPPDPDEDVMFRNPPKRKTVSAPRMTATIPPVRGAGPIEPLPRARSPVGTNQNLQTIKAPPPAVRVATAPPHRAVSIPPLTLDEDEGEVTNPGPSALSRPTNPGLPIKSRVTRPTFPPPTPSRASSRPSLQSTSDFAYPIVQPPASAPAASFDFEQRHAAEMAIAEPALSGSWAEKELSTAQIPKRNDLKSILGKLIAPMIVLVIAGIFIGGYFAFDGDGKKKKATATEGAKITMPVTNAAAAAEGAKREPVVPPNLAAASADATESAKSSASAAPAKAEVAKADADAAKADAAKLDDAANAAKADAAKLEAAKSDAAKLEAAKADAAKADAAKAAAKADAAKLDAKADAAKADAKADAAKVDATLEAAKAASAKAAAAKPALGAATGKPTLVDVRVDSNPSGATVTLIDRGKSTFLGTTPLSAAVDVSRKYELVFSYENRATVVESLDPSATKRVSVKLSRLKGSSSSSSRSEARASKIATPKFDLETPKAEKKKSEKPATGIDAALDAATKSEGKPDKAEKIEKAETTKTEAPKVEASGEGVLMISSKPPCEILIDGKPTGLTTPQREIKLPAGAHKVTLVNTAEGIKKTVSIQITADKPTKVIQDFMK